MSLKDKIKIIERKRITDSRGWFLKVITGKEELLPNHTGEVYLISANKGECRANHYHLEAHEWFTGIMGEIEMKLYDLKTEEVETIILSEKNPTTVYVPCGIAHSFKNIGYDPYLLVIYTDKLFDQKDTIPFAFKL